MSSRRQTAVDKLDRTITRLYTYLSGSEGEEAECSPAQRRPVSASTAHLPLAPQLGSSTNNTLQQQQLQQQQQHHYRDEPEYQQPYAYPAAHAVPYNPYAANLVPVNGTLHDTPTSDQAGSDVTLTESELALTRETTLPISNGVDHRQEDFDDIGDHPRTMGRLNGRPPLPLNAMMTGSSTPMSLQHNRTTANNFQLQHPHQHPQLLQQQQPQYQNPAAVMVKTNQDDDVDDHVPTTLLKRTPSGSLFIPTDMPMNSTLDYKHNMASPTKNHEKNHQERCLMSFDTHLRMSGVRPQSNLFNPTGAARSTGGLRKSLSLSSRCSWKCTAILFMLASAVLVAALAYLTAAHFVNWPPQPAKSHTIQFDDGVGNSGDVLASNGGGTDASNSTGGRRPSIGSSGGKSSIIEPRSQFLDVHALVGAWDLNVDEWDRRRDALIARLRAVDVRTGRRSKRRADQQDEEIWNLLKEWIQQEERLEVSDQPHNEEAEGSGERLGTDDLVAEFLIPAVPKVIKEREKNEQFFEYGSMSTTEVSTDRSSTVSFENDVISADSNEWTDTSEWTKEEENEKLTTTEGPTLHVKVSTKIESEPVKIEAAAEEMAEPLIKLDEFVGNVTSAESNEDQDNDDDDEVAEPLPSAWPLAAQAMSAQLSVFAYQDPKQQIDIIPLTSDWDSAGEPVVPARSPDWISEQQTPPAFAAALWPAPPRNSAPSALDVGSGSPPPPTSPPLPPPPPPPPPLPARHRETNETRGKPMGDDVTTTYRSIPTMSTDTVSDALLPLLPLPPPLPPPQPSDPNSSLGHFVKLSNSPDDWLFPAQDPAATAATTTPPSFAHDDISRRFDQVQLMSHGPSSQLTPSLDGEPQRSDDLSHRFDKVIEYLQPTPLPHEDDRHFEDLSEVGQNSEEYSPLFSDQLPKELPTVEMDSVPHGESQPPEVLFAPFDPLQPVHQRTDEPVDHDGNSFAALLLLSLAGNISEDVLTPWQQEGIYQRQQQLQHPDVISYRGPMLPVAEPSHCQCDCLCPACPLPSTTITASTDAMTTTDSTTSTTTASDDSFTTEAVENLSTGTPTDLVCLELTSLAQWDGATTLVPTSSSPTAPTTPTKYTIPTTASPSTTLTTTTTSRPIPPILVLEGTNTFPARTFPPDGTTFEQLTLGDKMSSTVAPYGYWNMQFYQSEAAYVKFEFGVPRGSSLGLYARRNSLPTHTHYDVMHLLSGFKSQRTVRASPSSVQKEVTQFMEPGHWFVSLYNDDGDPQEVTCLVSLSRDLTLSCPRGCNANGECILGRCQCRSGFAGDDCSESVCPVLCSGRGDYINGRCQCIAGWKGQECSLKHDECEVPDCNGHGKCSSGKCVCARGFKGEFCDIVDCPHPTCMDHGFCVEGVCLCKKGWKGLDCSQVDSEAMQCLPDCSGQGTFSIELHKCLCADGWTGEDCSKPACAINCGGHGSCEASSCVCETGWMGEFCNERLCDPRCDEHGQCKNGTCLCVAGWNGRHCTFEGCPKECSKHGQCKSTPENGWSCRCDKGWEGADCSIALELECEDGRDNDKDGLVDCEDSDCCQSRHCKKSPLCVTAPKPIDILLRKQPPAVTASFYERMKFLIEEGSLQSYAKQDAFNESRAAVVRGKVVTENGLGLFGVRVSSSNPLEGFTLTRDDGWFDLMVNGGGAVILHFGRSPFRPRTRTVNVPWNEVVILDTVSMSTQEERLTASVTTVCDAHDYDSMRPVVLATWKHGFQGSCPGQSAILAESQVVQESLAIPGTSSHLVYHSSRSTGYLSTIQLQLTPDAIPSSLSKIHLRITVEGILFEKVFEADPGIKFTYAWNRFNIYRQRVYGITTVLVKVGYQYTTCPETIWEVQMTKLNGHDMSISDIGGWNLDIHHRYNFHEGILQKGDGNNIYLRYRPEVLRTTMGDGHQRPLDCTKDCQGPAAKQRVLAPVALTASPDGSLYLGDFNLIRRIGTDGDVKTLLKLNTTRVSYRYHMALSPVDHVLYLSDPEAHQIIRIKNMNDFSDPEHNWEPVIGSGERCLPGDESDCGDGGLARDAKLAYPKGVAISVDNVLYFADATNIRMVDRDGIITTVVGNHQHRTHWNPMPCEGTLVLNEVRLRWPTEIAISPLDGALHVIDDHMIVRLTIDGRMKIVAGRPLHCAPAQNPHQLDFATHATLVMPQALAFGPNGDLYVAESDSQRINRVRRISTDGRITTVAGQESKCNCLDLGCNCFDEDRYLATSSRFNTISAIAVTPDSVLHICDQANYRLRAITSNLPEANQSRLFDIYMPETQEIYVFNRFGQHVATRNIVTGRNVYLFGYNVNTSNGKLSTVTDSAGNKLFLLRDYSNQVTSIENTKGHKSRLRMSRTRLLQEFSSPEGHNVTFEYIGSTGLLKSRVDSTGQSIAYIYDDNGRLTSTVSPTGEVIDLTFDLSLAGASVRVVHGQRSPVVYFTKGSSVSKFVGQSEEIVSLQADRSVVVMTPYSHLIATETSPYAILSDRDAALGEIFPVPGKQKVEIGGELVSRLEWRYFVRRRSSNQRNQREIVQLGKKMRVNGENLITVEYDRDSLTEAIYMEDRAELLNITYDDMSRPIRWSPRSSFVSVQVSYDRFGQLALWKQGEMSEAYNYDRSGRLSEVIFADGHKVTYTFGDAFSTLPSQMTTEREHTYLMQYDDVGALQSVTTPRGHIHSVALQMIPGHTKFLYYSPVSRQPHKLFLDDQGRVAWKVLPGQSSRILYTYSNESRLAGVVAGISETTLDYYEDTGLLKSVAVKDRPYEMRHEFKYHGGLVKEERIKFGAKTGLDHLRSRYKYDGNGRLALIETEINGRELPPHAFNFNQNLGVLEGVNDLRVYRNAFNRTVIQDSTKHYFRISDRDHYGRTCMTLINIKGYDAFKYELEFDQRNRLRSRRVVVGQKTTSQNLSYNAEGSLVQVQGSSHTFKYTYDDNGNVVTMNQDAQKITLGYDAGDRVSSVDDVVPVTYDQRGFVVRSGAVMYAYNDRGQLSYVSQTSKYRVWYNYDFRGRLAVWRDDQGNVSQFFYTNPLKPHLLTHLHMPKLGRTVRLHYDDNDHLISMETPDQRWYVATDENGTPLVVFNVHGTVVKLVERTPFGRLIQDSDPGVYIGVDFRGGIVNPHTGLVHFGDRVYDPTIAQWLTPEWERLATHLRRPQDVFLYRFHNNDPVNSDNKLDYMTNMDSWLKLFGYSWNDIVGMEYSAATLYTPSTLDCPKDYNIGHLGVISGLRCLTENVQNGFSALSFVPPPMLRDGSGDSRRNYLPGIAFRKPSLGNGVLLSRVQDRATVAVVDATSGGALKDVLTSVLDSAFWLDMRTIQGDQDVFYFVKESNTKLADDQENLKRLSGVFNISLVENEQGAGSEVRVSNAELALVLTYGVGVQQAKHRLLRLAHRRAIEGAWLREKQLVEAGLPGQVEWTPEERAELIANGQVEGFTGGDLHSIYDYPLLADDPSNIIFRRDTKRKRRKSRRFRPYV